MCYISSTIIAETWMSNIGHLLHTSGKIRVMFIKKNPYILYTSTSYNSKIILILSSECPKIVLNMSDWYVRCFIKRLNPHLHATRALHPHLCALARTNFHFHLQGNRFTLTKFLGSPSQQCIFNLIKIKIELIFFYLSSLYLELQCS